MATILCVDADQYLSDLVRYALVRAGFEVQVAYTGGDARRLIRAARFDLILLDVNLPDMHGLQVLAVLRTFSRVPVVLLTTRTREEDIIAGFGQGADDYVVKPVSMPVLIERVKAVLRRATAHRAPLPEPACGPTYRLQGAIFDAAVHAIVSDGQCVTLTPTESRILHLLAAHAGHALSAERIWERIWGYDSESDVNVIKTHIRHLRAKIGRLPGDPQPIRTVPGVGYVVQPAEAHDTELTRPDLLALHAAS